jgi:hypothetical protein
MPTAAADAVSVLLVGLPAFYEGLLRQEFKAEPAITVTRLPETAAATVLPPGPGAVIVVGAKPPLLRRAAELFARDSRLLGVVAVTDDEPRGDVYLVAPAGRNVSRHELAQVIRDVVASRPGAARAAPFPTRATTRSNP